jgi:hypothetical protein
VQCLETLGAVHSSFLHARERKGKAVSVTPLPLRYRPIPENAFASLWQIAARIAGGVADSRQHSNISRAAWLVYLAFPPSPEACGK